ncbi:uncharacterized protein C8A04DRAFT_14820 [Dichotomopilus funicola]|uniref:Uncharacterized protein n=1 Tax=Dichotomopilus funicola TaxID=1934379 RepID=A0AAN6ZK55_9PEZI|nr:hypothetical protein C8A04DRAFT_14820 [Dichotomopilus funicola]
MCIAVVKHCPCVKCMDKPSPETTERLDYCADKQEMLRGTWDGNTSMPMFTRQKLMMPCHELTYMRALDANMCLFKKDNASPADTIAAPAAETAVADERPLIKFTPINIPTKGRSKLANSLSNDTSGHIHKRARLDGPSTTTKTGTATGTALTTAAALTHLAENFARENNTTNNNSSPNPTSSTIVHPASSTITATSSPACNNNSSSPLAPTPSSTTHGTGTGTGTPGHTGTTGRTGSTGITNSKGRTPLPNSRPMTPRVIQATAAAAAADLAARVARGVWTHEESVKVLLLRCREIEYNSARAREVLPGRDAAACEDQLLDLALKYGYEDHI